MKKDKPRCKYCGIHVGVIKSKSGEKITVENRSICYYEYPDGVYEIITPKGTRRRGVIVGEGQKGYMEHKCRKQA